MGKIHCLGLEIQIFQKLYSGKVLYLKNKKKICTRKNSGAENTMIANASPVF